MANELVQNVQSQINKMQNNEGLKCSRNWGT